MTRLLETSSDAMVTLVRQLPEVVFRLFTTTSTPVRVLVTPFWTIMTYEELRYAFMYANIMPAVMD